MERIHLLIRAILNELFPARCFKCGATSTYICTSCLPRLPRTVRDEQGFISVFQYKDETIRHLLWALKYKGSKDVAYICARMLYEEVCAELSERTLFEEFENPLVVPIPLSARRRRERGFNQAELIAREMAATGTFELQTSMLEKCKETKPQATIKNRAERFKNVAGCFKISSPEKIVERNIILVDDIYTTGGTMTEARATLKKAGAREVLCVTVAH